MHNGVRIKIVCLLMWRENNNHKEMVAIKARLSYCLKQNKRVFQTLMNCIIIYIVFIARRLTLYALFIGNNKVSEDDKRCLSAIVNQFHLSLITDCQRVTKKKQKMCNCALYCRFKGVCA